MKPSDNTLPAITGTETAETVPSENTGKLRVLIVEDHPITRHGLRTLVNQQLNLTVSAETDSTAEALEMAATLQPDLALVDISLKGTSGIDLMKDLRDRAPGMAMLAVSMHDEALFAERALRAGALGYVMKHEAADKITGAIQQVLRGELYLSAKMRERVLHRFVSKKNEGLVFAMDLLSQREMEVFELIGDGYSTRQIAEKLALSSKTIDSYREHLKLKLGLETGAELLRHAIQWVRSESLAKAG